MRACAIVPAFDCERTVGTVVLDLFAHGLTRDEILVVDDGSGDRTSSVAEGLGVRLVSHARNLGKGAALRTGFEAARKAGFDVAVTVDGDGQHPAVEARRLLDEETDGCALVLGIRDLARDGAPRANRFSNRISNFFLSAFCRQRLRDTQCGLRRYPLSVTLALGGRDAGYAYEAEILLRAVAAKVRIVQVPVRVVYPPAEERITHFDSVRDPARIIGRVLWTLATTGPEAPSPRSAGGPPASAPS